MAVVTTVILSKAVASILTTRFKDKNVPLKFKGLTMEKEKLGEKINQLY